jgi:hypothetical protein
MCELLHKEIYGEGENPGKLREIVFALRQLPIHDQLLLIEKTLPYFVWADLVKAPNLRDVVTTPYAQFLAPRGPIGREVSEAPWKWQIGKAKIGGYIDTDRLIKLMTPREADIWYLANGDLAQNKSLEIFALSPKNYAKYMWLGPDMGLLAEIYLEALNYGVPLPEKIENPIAFPDPSVCPMYEGEKPNPLFFELWYKNIYEAVTAVIKMGVFQEIRERGNSSFVEEEFNTNSAWLLPITQ